MTSVNPANQYFRVTGDLQIQSPSLYNSNNALISFRGDFNAKLGQIRAFGFGGGITLLLDSSECYGGLAIRSSSSQGDAYFLNGQGDQYAFECTREGITTIKRLDVALKATAYAQDFDGTSIFRVNKQNTVLTSSLTNSLAEFTINSMRANEHLQILVGNNPYGGCAVYGYEMGNTTSASSNLNTSYLGMKSNNVLNTNIRMYTNGNVDINGTLKLGTLDAQTITPASVLPLTLDKANNRVGVNTITPIYPLDITGDCNLSAGSKFRIDGVDITPNLTPLTLDGTNNRVGVNQTTPAYPLDIAGDCNLSAGSKFRINGVDITPNLTPLTLDSTNNRVGINYATPLYALDVVGDCNIQTASASPARYRIQDIDVLTSTTLGSSVVNSSLTNVGTLSSLTVGSVLKVVPATSRVGINTASPAYTLDVTGDMNLSTGSKYRIAGQALNEGTGSFSVAVGGASAQGNYTVAIGQGAGATGIYGVSIGASAGSTSQGGSGVAIGYIAGNNTQGGGSIAIGRQAGQTTQGAYSTAVGYLAGSSNQGATSIAIGCRAGTTNQHANTIILNALGPITDLNSAGTNRFYIAPIRSDTTASLMLGYNTSTYEVTYKTAPPISSGTGSPEGVVTANVGSMFLRTDGGVGTTLYVKETGTDNTGWAAK